VWVHPEQGDVHIIGTWDDWARPGIVPEPHEGGWKLARFELPPGDHGYLLDLGSETTLDPHQPLTTFDIHDDDREVSLLAIGDCGQPRLDVSSVRAEDGELSIAVQFLANRDVAELATVTATTASGRDLAIDALNPDTGEIVVGGRMDAPRETITIAAEDEDGNVVTQRVAAWDGGRDPRDEVLYQVMIDRFRGDGGGALDPPRHAGARAGGTLDGIRASLDDITDLGATALWISPVYQGPDEERAGNDGRMYEGYHGYWPIDTRKVEARIGGEEALEALIDSAHDERMMVLADVVPNHVYETHPRYAEHADAGWFHPTGCVCGTESCPWHEHIQECWFTPYLPDMRLEHPDVLDASVSDVSWLMKRFELDGLRVDAVPMMPRAASRRLAHRIRHELQPQGAAFLLGEIFTGPGLGGLLQLKRHLGPAGLNSVFDFPLMWAIHDAVATGRGGFDAVDAVLETEEIELEGSGAVLARILDNHDTPRFISVANGDGNGDPWDAPAEQPQEAEPYQRLQIALALIFTLPGIPVVFQGDEIGLAGANDPDCRRVMPREEELNEHQRAVRETVRQLGKIRRDSPALRRGERLVVEAARALYVFERRAEEESVVVVLSTAEFPQVVETTLSGTYTDAFSGESVTLDSLDVAPLSFRVFVRQR
jgi:glycosidase